ncbi:MAG: glycine cleavage system protein H [Oligoflexia bacterium]|nr:glycine cleavage system protein H [Oligoflexia bacterium]
MAKAGPKSGEFNEGKFWFYRKNSVLTVGLTSLATDEIGQVESIEFPDEGGDFVKGDVVVTIEGSSGRLEVTTPASGIIHEINEQAKAEPDIVSEDPLEEGWLVKLEIQDASDLQEFANEDEEE